eukprot:1272839-Pleurochrysis_carterae.AAC.1
MFYELGQSFRRGCSCFVKGERHSVGQVGGDQMCDVFLLFELHAVGVCSDVNVEQIRNWTFVLNIPALGERVDELTVKGADAFVRVESKKIIYVAAQNKLVAYTGYDASHGEDTGV